MTQLFKLQPKLKEVKAMSKVWVVEKGNSTELMAKVRTELKESLYSIREPHLYQLPINTTMEDRKKKLKDLVRKEEASLRLAEFPLYLIISLQKEGRKFRVPLIFPQILDVKLLHLRNFHHLIRAHFNNGIKNKET